MFNCALCGKPWDGHGTACDAPLRFVVSDRTPCPQCTGKAAVIADLRRQLAEFRDQARRHDHEIEQTLAAAIGGFPRYADDRRNFPDAVAADGFCVGEHVPETLAALAAATIADLRRRLSERPPA